MKYFRVYDVQGGYVVLSAKNKERVIMKALKYLFGIKGVLKTTEYDFEHNWFSLKWDE